MRAVVKTAPGVGNVDVRDVAEPSPPPGHALIAVRAAGICGTDIHIYRDEFTSRPPVVMGHEVAGEIVAVGARDERAGSGDGIERIRVGDRVTTETYFSTCGVCRYCRSGRANLCPWRLSIGSAVNGGFTRLLVVPTRNVHRLPDGVDFVAGALTEPLACVVHGAVEQARLAPRDVAVIAGPGAIGLLTLQVVKAAGAVAIVLGTSRDERRLDLARELGADAVYNVEEGDAYKGAIAELTDGAGADVVYECSWAGPAAAMLLDLARRGGHYAQIGLFGKPIGWNLDQVCYKELTVTGSNASVPSAWDRALKLMADGLVRTAPLVSGVYPLTEWRAAFDVFEQGTGVKTVLQPTEAS